MRVRGVGAAVALGVSLLCAPGRARADGLAGPSLAPETRIAEALYTVRTESALQDARQAWVLLGWGGLNLLGGTAVALSGAGGDLGRSVAVNSLVWGAVNVAVSIPWLLMVRAEQRSAPVERALRGPRLRDRREELMRERYGQALVFGVNTGLDVAYVATGVLLSLLALQQTPRNDALLGVGAAAAGQGTFLLAFDFAGWMTSVGRANRIAGVPRGD